MTREDPVPIKRAFHQGLSRLAAKWPALSRRLVASFNPIESATVPWHPVRKPLAQSRLALVTTAGVHHRRQQPFDMQDSQGDPSFRVIDGQTIAADYNITHDYYDHRDADRDLNIVFPITRLKEMAAAGCIGKVADEHFSLMGHIDGRHVHTLMDRTTPEIVRRLKAAGVDYVLLTPA
jgi:D-proline reductase (dithiol) PrdB